MSSDPKACLIATLFPLFLLVASCASSDSDQTPKRYESPKAVFDALRQADQNGDWRTFYFLFTSKVQRDLVFEAQFACVVAEKVPALRLIQKQFGPTEVEFGKRYFAEYKKKHGHAEVIDRFLAKAIPYWESKDKGAGGTEAGPAGVVPPPPESSLINALPQDEELSRQAVYDATRDKVGFFAEVQKIDRRRRKLDIIGDLEQVTIDGEAATGHAKITVVPQAGESPLKPGQAPAVYEKPFKFRRVNGGWLMDSL